jgi:hypothetical protein
MLNLNVRYGGKARESICDYAKGVDGINTRGSLRVPRNIAQRELLTWSTVRAKVNLRRYSPRLRRQNHPLGGRSPGPRGGASREDPGRVVVGPRSSDDRAGSDWGGNRVRCRRSPTSLCSKISTRKAMATACRG